MDGNKKNKLLTKFDIVVIVVVILAAAAFLVWQASKSTESDAPGSGSGTVRFSVEITNVPESTTLSISPGDEITDTVKNTHVGTVVSFEAKKHVVWGTNLETGDVIPTETDLYSVIIVIDAPCNISESSITTQGGGLEVRIGESMGVSGPGYWGSGYIVAIERS